MGESSALALAGRQDGVLRCSQALELGLTEGQLRTRLRQRRWERVLPGVVRIEGAPRTWWQRLRAASLWLGRGFAFSHRTAAALWGLSPEPEPAVLEARLTGKRRPRPDIRLIRTTALLPREFTFQRGFRVTSLPRTFLDLAALRWRHLDDAVDDALARRLISLERLASFVAWRAGERGSCRLRRLVEVRLGRGGVPESRLERRVLELIDAEGLPPPQLQQRLKTRTGTSRLDFRFPGTPIAIEADGYAYHSTIERFEHDRRRQNALAARGLIVLHWTWAGLEERPDELVDELRSLLDRFARPSR